MFLLWLGYLFGTVGTIDTVGRIIDAAFGLYLLTGFPLLLCDAGRLRSRFAGRARIPAILSTILWFAAPFFAASPDSNLPFFHGIEPMNAIELYGIILLSLLSAFYLCCVLWKFANLRSAEGIARLIPAVWLAIEALLLGSLILLIAAVLLLVCLSVTVILRMKDQAENG